MHINPPAVHRPASPVRCNAGAVSRGGSEGIVRSRGVIRQAFSLRGACFVNFRPSPAVFGGRPGSFRLGECHRMKSGDRKIQTGAKPSHSSFTSLAKIASFGEMNESPPALPSDFKLRKGYLVTSGILFVLAGLNLCGFGALMVVQYFLMDQLGGLDPKGAAQLAPMKDMMGMAAVANLMIYGGTGVLMIVLAVGFFTKKRWSRPIALTVSWAWLYIGVTMIVSLLLMMGAMKSFMVDAMKTATPAGTTAPPMENFFRNFPGDLLRLSLFLPRSPAGAASLAQLGP
jgi:hypothetical protein